VPERRDISTRGIAVGVAIIVIGIAAAVLAASLLVRAVNVPGTGASGGKPPKIEGPALQTSPHEDLQAFLREKQERLSSSGRVDDQHVHIPIDRAMRMLAKGRQK
jgi:hypothetical protein